LEEDHIRFHARAVRRKRAARQAKDCVQIAILHENFEYFASFAFEQAIIRQDDRGASARFERSQNVLNEIKLLIACLDGEISALRRLIRAFCSERRIRQNHIVPVSAEWLIDCVTKVNVRFDSVQK
jgi:hypothetical protein